MEQISDSQSVISLRDRWTGPDLDPSRADISTVSDSTSQLEFDAGTNRGIPSLEAIQATSGRDNKKPVGRIRKK